jgi:hypothetical protein
VAVIDDSLMAVGSKHHVEGGLSMFFVSANYSDEPALKASERLQFVSLPAAEARVREIMSGKRELSGEYAVALTSERPGAVVPVVVLWEGGR